VTAAEEPRSATEPALLHGLVGVAFGLHVPVPSVALFGCRQARWVVVFHEGLEEEQRWTTPRRITRVLLTRRRIPAPWVLGLSSW
jgi:hypothetical protein